MRGAATLLPGVVLLGAFACGGVNTPDGEPPPRELSAGGASAGTLTLAPLPMPPDPADAAGAGGVSNGGSSSQTETETQTETPTDSPPLPPIEFCDAPAKTLVPSCGGGSCHSNPGATIGDFAVDTQRAYDFVDKVSVRHAECGRIIDSRDYSKSFLLLKVRGDFDSPYCGGRMPVGSIPITEAQINCLASWLQQFQL